MYSVQTPTYKYSLLLINCHSRILPVVVFTSFHILLTGDPTVQELQYSANFPASNTSSPSFRPPRPSYLFVFGSLVILMCVYHIFCLSHPSVWRFVYVYIQLLTSLSTPCCCCGYPCTRRGLVSPPPSPFLHAYGKVYMLDYLHRDSTKL